MEQLQQIRNRLQTTKQTSVLVRTGTLLKLVVSLLDSKQATMNAELEQLFARRKGGRDSYE